MDFIVGNYTFVTVRVSNLPWTADCPVSPVSDFVLYDFNGEHWIDDANKGWSAPSNTHVFFP